MTNNHSDNGEKDFGAYAGRWIARLRGRVVSQGGTPEQAQRAAKSSRRKETPEINYVPTSSPLTFSPMFERVRQALSAKTEIYLVGGAVRDALLKRESHDLDFTLPKDSLKTAKKVANALQGAYYKMDEEHQVGRVILVEEDGKRMIMDFTAMLGSNLEDDLRGRDFTVNAMAIDVHQPQELLDPLGGLPDLLNKQLRICSPTSFSDDPVRVYRAMRIASGYQLRMSEETKTLLKQAVKDLPNVSVERLRDELFKILDGPKPTTSIRALDMLGAISHLLPELDAMKGVTQSPPHNFDVWDHSLQTLQRLEVILNLLDEDYVHDNESGGDLASGLISQRLGRYRTQITQHLNTPLNTERSIRALVYFAALYHDIGKPESRKVDEDGRIRFFEHEHIGAKIASKRGKKLRLSNGEVDRVKTIIKNHLRPLFLSPEGNPPSRRSIFRFFRDTEEAGVDICLLSLADLLAKHGQTTIQEELSKQLDVVRALLEAYWEQREEIVYPLALVDGSDVIKKFKLKPGPQVGELLKAIREAQATGEVKNKKEAFAFGEEWLKK